MCIVLVDLVIQKSKGVFGRFVFGWSSKKTNRRKEDDRYPFCHSENNEAFENEIVCRVKFLFVVVIMRINLLTIFGCFLLFVNMVWSNKKITFWSFSS